MKPIILLGSAGNYNTCYAEAIMECYENPKRITAWEFYRTPHEFWRNTDCLVVESVRMINADNIRHLMSGYSTNLVFIMQDMEIESDTYILVKL